jgi:hypothetical protein
MIFDEIDADAEARGNLGLAVGETLDFRSAPSSSVG